jgi:hypothetical protein
MILITNENITVIDNYENIKNELCPITCEIIINCIITKCNHKFSKEGFTKYAETINNGGYVNCPLCREILKIYDNDKNQNQNEENNITIICNDGVNIQFMDNSTHLIFNTFLHPERIQPQGTVHMRRIEPHEYVEHVSIIT